MYKKTFTLLVVEPWFAYPKSFPVYVVDGAGGGSVDGWFLIFLWVRRLPTYIQYFVDNINTGKYILPVSF